MYVQFLGDLFLRMLKMLIVPLLTCSIISAIGNLDLSLSKKIGVQSIMYYVATTTFAVFQGIFWVLVIRPGRYSKDETSMNLDAKTEARNVTTVDTLLDLVRYVTFQLSQSLPFEKKKKVANIFSGKLQWMIEYTRIPLVYFLNMQQVVVSICRLLVLIMSGLGEVEKKITQSI